MSQHYSNPSRESYPYALPDVEVFYLNCQTEFNGTQLEQGWYYWYCFHSEPFGLCMPDSEPFGPYRSEQEVVDAMRAESDS